MTKVAMKEQDILELYQLLSLYKKTYMETGEQDIDGWLGSIASRYQERSHKDIRLAHNPRGAGRKRLYTDDKDKEIIRLRKTGMAIRSIAKETGVSPGYVQGVIKK